MFKKIYFLVHAITSLSVAAISHSSSLSTHPFLSITFTFYAPVLAVTAVSLLALLRLGVTQQAREAKDSAAKETRDRTEEKSGELERDSSPSGSRPSEADPRSEASFAPRTRYKRRFVEWDVKAPLEVIYEEYEGEGDEEEDDDRGFGLGGIERYPSLWMCYSDLDSDSSSAGNDFGFNFRLELPEEGIADLGIGTDPELPVRMQSRTGTASSEPRPWLDVMKNEGVD